MTADRGLRGARAGVFSGLCGTLAAHGHGRMAGLPVSPWLLGLVLLGLGAAAWVFAARERGPVAVVGAALGAQALAHLVFSLASAKPPPPPPAHLHTHVHAPGYPVAHPVPGDGGPGGMLAAHLLIAALGALWLWRGERAVFTLIRRAVRRVLSPPPAPSRAVVPPAPPSPAGGDETPPVPVPVRRPLSRGPPPRLPLSWRQHGATVGPRP